MQFTDEDALATRSSAFKNLTRINARKILTALGVRDDGDKLQVVCDALEKTDRHARIDVARTIDIAARRTANVAAVRADQPMQQA